MCDVVFDKYSTPKQEIGSQYCVSLVSLMVDVTVIQEMIMIDCWTAETCLRPTRSLVRRAKTQPTTSRTSTYLLTYLTYPRYPTYPDLTLQLAFSSCVLRLSPPHRALLLHMSSLSP